MAAVKTAGAGRHPDFLRGTLAVDDDLAAVFKGQGQDAAGAFQVDVDVQVFNGILDGEQDGIDGGVEVGIVHGVSGPVMRG